MRLLSLRPERSASANSATPACFYCGVNFISKSGFVNLNGNITELAQHIHIYATILTYDRINHWNKKPFSSLYS
jgi:hypothetical protein